MGRRSSAFGTGERSTGHQIVQSPGHAAQRPTLSPEQTSADGSVIGHVVSPPSGATRTTPLAAPVCPGSSGLRGTGPQPARRQRRCAQPARHRPLLRSIAHPCHCSPPTRGFALLHRPTACPHTRATAPAGGRSRPFGEEAPTPDPAPLPRLAAPGRRDGEPLCELPEPVPYTRPGQRREIADTLFPPAARRPPPAVRRPPSAARRLRRPAGTRRQRRTHQRRLDRSGNLRQPGPQLRHVRTGPGPRPGPGADRGTRSRSRSRHRDGLRARPPPLPRMPRREERDPLRRT